MIGKPANSISDDNAPQLGYPQTKLNKIRVYKQRAHYDYQTVHSITDSTLVSQVSFIARDEDGEAIPMAMPLTAVLGRYGDAEAEVSDGELERQQKENMTNGPMDLYLHGNVAALLYKAIRESESGHIRVCISSTKVDGLALFPTPNGHSLNYRSATIHGTASIVPDTDVRKKRFAMRLLTNHMYHGRWETTYPVLHSAVDIVKVIEVKVLSASAKIRAANIGPFDPATVEEEEKQRREEQGTGVWSGVVPLYEVLGQPAASNVEGPGGEPRGLKAVEEWRQERNRREKEYAERVAR
ncbi:hypothetical protein A1O3_10370 [Capronia epimyces CBS 606.96]|uniref:Flavin-nucleotide-binding protein n=1 Tax=Capronia epimyces CBS 606.96 TaxID=1182542 RepID=W9X9R9_9EURO|nr:uncharacterized protein A1O3_10370 [Capronia epimyces CBS 606.96]EXJ77212.1 hypothetical protein A1O3_10370 [Capronia epimyces CBS 606.96]